MINEFTTLEAIFFIGNIVLFFVSQRTFNFFYLDNEELAKPRIKASLYLTGSLFVLQVLHILIKLNVFDKSLNEITYKIFYTLLTIYGMLLFQSSVHYFIKMKLGTKNKVDDKDIAADTPSSRMWSLITLVIIIFATIYINIQIWSAASMMETTGIVGISLGALALTNSVWFPDIYSGIIILKNKSFSVGDTVCFDEEEELYIVNKATFFHLELLSVIDNNRTTIPNHILSSFKTHNLSKVSTQQGLRRTIKYKIGYPKQLTIEGCKIKIEELKNDKKYSNVDLSVEFIREKQIMDYIEKIRKLSKEAQEHVLKQENTKNICLSEHEFRVGVSNTGDHAIEFVLSYYIKPLKKSFVTERIRDYLVRTPLLVNEAMLLKSYKYGIDLSTPITYVKNN